MRNRATFAAEALLDGEAEALTRKAVEMALAGDAAALRLCLDRLIAPRRERPVPIALPPMRDAGDIASVMRAIVAALGRGDIAPAEAGEAARVVDTFLRAIETSDFDRRLKAVEARDAALA